MNIQVINAGKPDAFRMLDLFENVEDGRHKVEVRDTRLIFNGGPNQYEGRLFAIHVPWGNFSKCLAVIWASHEGEALDEACDRDLLDAYLIDRTEEVAERLREFNLNEADEDYEEQLDRAMEKVYELMDEEYVALGNASELFDLQTALAHEIPPQVWQADWQFVYWVGASRNGDFETGDEVGHL